MSGPSSAPQPSQPDDGKAALIAALLEVERHVSSQGWDSQPRLFALVFTEGLLAAEPQLAATQGLRGVAEGGSPGGLTAVEQEHFVPSGDLLDDLASVVWPETVFGCAVSVERSFLPATAEDDIPDDPVAAAAFVAQHPERGDVRVLVGVDRAGNTHGVGRLVAQPEELLAAENLVPGLSAALAHTLTAE